MLTKVGLYIVLPFQDAYDLVFDKLLSYVHVSMYGIPLRIYIRKLTMNLAHVRLRLKLKRHCVSLKMMKPILVCI